MSYNGKQTTEVRLPRTNQLTHADLCILDKEFTLKKKKTSKQKITNHNMREGFHASAHAVKCFETLLVITTPNKQEQSEESGINNYPPSHETM